MVENREKLVVDKTVCVIGGSGMVGSRFVEMFGGANFLTPSGSELDITDKEAVRAFIKREKPDFIINFAAYTNVGEAEKQRDQKDGSAWQTNVEGPVNIMDALEEVGLEKTVFIQISTDMALRESADNPVPFGESQLAETDSNKLTWYGYTKAEAERQLLERMDGRAVILRIIYPVRKEFTKKLDYLRGPLEKYCQGKLHPLFNDQRVSLTFIDEACEALARIIKGKHRGIFHASSPDTSTPHKIISQYLSLVEGKEVKLASRPVGDLAERYPDTSLDVTQTERILGMKFSPIAAIVGRLATS